MFIACVMVIVTWMYNIFTHQIVYINYKKFFVYQLVFNKVGKILKKKLHKYWVVLCMEERSVIGQVNQR